VLAFLLALFPAMASAHTEDDPLIVDLLAGQTEDIGDVLVWNDADNLYVKFVYTGPDCGFLEVHLQVDEGDWDEGILTKKGNPIPGQFEKSYSPGFCFPEHTFTYILADEGWTTDTELMIAAHAAMGLAETMTIVSDTSTAVTEVNGLPVTATNAVLANEPVGYPNCATYAPDGTGSVWDSSVNIPGAHWIWNTLNPEHPIEGDVVTFTKTFTVPGLPNGGTLNITADNGYNATLNGVPLGQAQLGPGFPATLKETTDTTPQAGNWGVASQGWQSVEPYSLVELVSGANTLVITAANEYMWNTTDQYLGKDYYYGSWDPSGGSVNQDPFPGYGLGVDNICRNPGGLIFKATMDYYASGETAWGAGTRFTEDKNWATYFRYTVQGEVETSYPETGNAYIGYEDWPNGDFDYNDFGMYFNAVETYWGTSAELYLTKVTMTFTSVIYDSGMDHLIHITRPIVGGSTYTVGRGVSAYTDETPAGTYTGSGDVDVTLFNTAKYSWPAKQINETVTIEIIVDEPALNPKTDLPAPRWDLDPFMANYDPWEVGTLYGSLFHIQDMQNVTAMSGGGGRLDTRLIGQTLPFILVVPDTDWIPPYEDTCISGPDLYGPYWYFYDYYNTSGTSHQTWYTEVTNNTVGWGGLSWAP
jgi:hypothetical protein